MTVVFVLTTRLIVRGFVKPCLRESRCCVAELAATLPTESSSIR